MRQHFDSRIAAGTRYVIVNPREEASRVMTENVLRVVVANKTRSYRTGPCSVTRTPANLRTPGWRVVKYKTRPWFSALEEGLSPSRANNVLTREGGQPCYEELFVVVISLKAGERARFAGDDEELCRVLRAATVEVMKDLAGAFGVPELVWVARPHPDYPNPCVKVLISRYVARRLRPVETFPRRMRTHWLKQERPGEPRVSVSGGCGDAFLRIFDAAVAEASPR